MTKVEELREHVVEEVVSDIKELATAWGDNEYLVKRKMQRMTSEIDALIAAVREDEREKIAENGQHFELGDDVSGSDYLTCVHLQPEVDVDVSVIAEEDCYIVPASILAPKESEKEGYA